MKHDYTNETIQDAIDEAFNTQSSVPWGSLDTRDKHDGHWKNESPARLTLARELLERLPDTTVVTKTLVSRYKAALQGIRHELQRIGGSQDSQPAKVKSSVVSINTAGCEPMDDDTKEALGAMVKAAIAPAWTPKVGDTVRLKSGGPVMTIKGGNQENQWCVWFDGAHGHSDNFPAVCLEPATKEEQQ